MVVSYNKRFVMFFVLFLAFTGFLILGTYIHEYAHYLDFKDYSIKETDRICILDSKFNGYYSFFISVEDKEAVDKIEEHTEFKAYGLELIIFLLMTHFVFVPYVRESLKR